MLTLLLRAAGAGDGEARRRLFEHIHSELHAIARRQMLREREDHTLGPTSLVNELYLRMGADAAIPSDSREQFFAYARACMANLLVDHARRRASQRRGGEWRAAGDTTPEDLAVAGDQETLASLDQALAALARINPRACRVLELRCLAGLEVEETAELLGVTGRTVVRDWQLARALLARLLDAGGDAPPLAHAR